MRRDVLALDDDDRLLDELRRPPSVDEAWETLRYWERRAERLGSLRRRERREAEHMVDVSRERLRAAERAAYGPPAWEPLARALRLDHLPVWQRRTRRRLRRAAITAAVVAGGMTATAAGGAAVVVAHLL
jgi:hypothetical protein